MKHLLDLQIIHLFYKIFGIRVIRVPLWCTKENLWVLPVLVGNRALPDFRMALRMFITTGTGYCPKSQNLQNKLYNWFGRISIAIATSVFMEAHFIQSTKSLRIYHTCRLETFYTLEFSIILHSHAVLHVSVHYDREHHGSCQVHNMNEGIWAVVRIFLPSLFTISYITGWNHGGGCHFQHSVDCQSR